MSVTQQKSTSQSGLFSNKLRRHFTQILRQFVKPFKTVRNRHAARKLLLQSPHLLDDIGLNRNDVIDALYLDRLADPTDHLDKQRCENLKIGERS